MGRQTLTLSALAEKAGVGRTCAHKYKDKLLKWQFGEGRGRSARFYHSAVKQLRAWRDNGLAQRGKWAR